MTELPFTTTYIKVDRIITTNNTDEELFDVGEYSTTTTRSEEVPAHINGAGGNQQEELRFKFYCEVCDINPEDTVTDLATHDLYQVVWVKERDALGLQFIEGELRLAASGFNAS